MSQLLMMNKRVSFYLPKDPTKESVEKTPKGGGLTI